MAHNRHYIKTLRFDDKVGAILDHESKRQNRSVNNLVETILLNSPEFQRYFQEKE